MWNGLNFFSNQRLILNVITSKEVWWNFISLLYEQMCELIATLFYPKMPFPMLARWHLYIKTVTQFVLTNDLDPRYVNHNRPNTLAFYWHGTGFDFACNLAILQRPSTVPVGFMIPPVQYMMHANNARAECHAYSSLFKFIVLLKLTRVVLQINF